jgi:Ni/Fe-hydrogenase subunit HybB-like protein
MATTMTTGSTQTPLTTLQFWSGYPRFLWRALLAATDGSALFYGWMTTLTALAAVGVNAWAKQYALGMGVTGLSDHVSWGLYIANFTFGVGLAAGGVMMVIPAYLYKDRSMHDVVILGELLAVAAIIICTLFIAVDLGRPDRFWHIIPGLGRFNWPMSMLTWDVIVLNGYLLLNLHICGYLLYTRFLRRRPNPVWYLPFVLLSIAWAISIHTVTAFLYQGLGGRPFWNSALLAPRFLTSAFVSGPVFLVMTMLIVRQVAGLRIPVAPMRTLVQIIRVAILVNLLMMVSELFTEFYTGSDHSSHAKYLFFGLHGKTALVPWMWSAVGLNVLAAIMLLHPWATRKPAWFVVAGVCAFGGVWIEKGMGLIVPGFVPSTLHELVEYTPTLAECQITLGIWAAGLMVYTLAVKIAVPILQIPIPEDSGH